MFLCLEIRTDILFSKFHFFSRSILTTSVIQTNQLWDELEKNMESFSKSRFLVLNALWNSPHSYNYLFHTCACRITSCMRLHTHGTINRMKPRWVYLPTCWLISLGLRKEKLALGGSCISSTFSRVAPTAELVTVSLDIFHFTLSLMPSCSCSIFPQDAVPSFWHLFCSWEKSPWDNMKGNLLSVVNPLKMKDALTGQILESCLWNCPHNSSRSCTWYVDRLRLGGNFEMWGHSGGNVCLFSKLV